MNAFVEDQLEAEDEAARQFAAENRRQVVSELRAQERHQQMQKRLLAEQERIAEEQDEWWVGGWMGRCMM